VSKGEKKRDYRISEEILDFNEMKPNLVYRMPQKHIYKPETAN